MAETRYTLAEAVDELAKRACADGRHAPCNRVATMGDLIGFFMCECGSVKWKPVH